MSGLKGLTVRLKVARVKVEREHERTKKMITVITTGKGEAPAAGVGFPLPSVHQAVNEAEEAVSMVVEADAEGDWRTNSSDNAAKAQTAISAAREQLDSQLRIARQQGRDAQKAAVAETGPLRKRLMEAQTRLDPYKRRRQDEREKQQAGKVVEQFAAKFREVDEKVDRIASMFEGPPPSREDVNREQRVLSTLKHDLDRAMKDVSDQLAVVAQGPLHDSLSRAKERGADTQHKIGALKHQLHDAIEKAEGHVLVEAVLVEVRKTEKCIALLSKAEAPWAKAEVVAEAEADQALTECEAAATACEPIIDDVKAFVEEKIVEAKALPEGMVHAGTLRELQELESQVEKAALRLAQFKVNTFARRVDLQIPDVVAQVVDSEKQVKKCSEVALLFSEDNLDTVPVKDLKAAAKKTLTAVEAASKVCEKAKKAITAKEYEPKVQNAPSFRTRLEQLRERLDAARARLKALATAAEDAEVNKSSYEDMKRDMEKLEKDVANVELKTVPMGDEKPSAAAAKKMTTMVVTARSAVAQAVATAERRAADGEESVRAAMQRISARGRALQKKLDDVWESRSDVLEKASLEVFMKEAKDKLEAVEEVMKKAGAAELPFLKGSDMKATTPAELKKFVKSCETATASAKVVVADAQSFFAAKNSEVARFFDLTAKTSLSRELTPLSKKVEGAAEKLRQMIADTENRKRTMVAA